LLGNCMPRKAPHSHNNMSHITCTMSLLPQRASQLWGCLPWHSAGSPPVAPSLALDAQATQCISAWTLACCQWCMAIACLTVRGHGGILLLPILPPCTHAAFRYPTLILSRPNWVHHSQVSLGAMRVGVHSRPSSKSILPLCSGDTIMIGLADSSGAELAVFLVRAGLLNPSWPMTWTSFGLIVPLPAHFIICRRMWQGYSIGRLSKMEHGCSTPSMCIRTGGGRSLE
jgi:hypothetical protein